MGVITEIERQKYFAYLDGVANGLNESRNDVNTVLDEIRAEIAEYKDDKIIHEECNEMIDIVLDIIDKYRESEGYE